MPKDDRSLSSSGGKFSSLYDLTCMPFYFLNLDLQLIRLSAYVQDRAANENDNAIVNFPEIRQACLFLLSKIATTRKKEPNSISKHAFVDFLDVLLHAELFRLKIVEQADLALNTWHAYFTVEKPGEALSSEEARKLDAIIKSKDEWRTVYMKILQKTIALVRLGITSFLEQYCTDVSK